MVAIRLFPNALSLAAKRVIAACKDYKLTDFQNKIKHENISFE